MSAVFSSVDASTHRTTEDIGSSRDERLQTITIDHHGAGFSCVVLRLTAWNQLTDLQYTFVTGKTQRDKILRSHAFLKETLWAKQENAVTIPRDCDNSKTTFL